MASRFLAPAFVPRRVSAAWLRWRMRTGRFNLQAQHQELGAILFLILGRAVFLRAVSVPEALESYKVRATRTLLFRKRVLAGLAVPADQVAVEADLAGEVADSRAVPEVDSPEALEASPGL